LITGASAGIGEACAWRFAEEGSRLILIGRRADRLKELKDKIQKEYPEVKCHCEPLSVIDIEKVMALPETLPDDFKKVDIIVNNAGLALGGYNSYK
jgi:NADP-dependent 3-hydroxy acid dehydrogenase YdfG